jgi:hypothetical protein
MRSLVLSIVKDSVLCLVYLVISMQRAATRAVAQAPRGHTRGARERRGRRRRRLGPPGCCCRREVHVGSFRLVDNREITKGINESGSRRNFGIRTGPLFSRVSQR